MPGRIKPPFFKASEMTCWASALSSWSHVAPYYTITTIAQLRKHYADDEDGGIKQGSSNYRRLLKDFNIDMRKWHRVSLPMNFSWIADQIDKNACLALAYIADTIPTGFLWHRVLVYDYSRPQKQVLVVDPTHGYRVWKSHDLAGTAVTWTYLPGLR